MQNKRTSQRGRHLERQPSSINWRTVMYAVMVAMLSVYAIYPYLHEIGHAIAASLLGGKVNEIVIYPSPYAECVIATDNTVCYVVTGLAGVIFPLLVTFVPLPDGLVSAVFKLSQRLMSSMYAVVETATSVRVILGRSALASDMKVVLEETSVSPYLILIITFSSAAFAFALVFASAHKAYQSITDLIQ